MAKNNGDKATKKNKRTPKKMEAPKMNYVTVGTVKSLNLSGCSFTIEPISKYRFEVKDGDEDSWKVVFVVEPNKEPENLKLAPPNTAIPFKGGLESAMVALKQAKSNIKVVIEGSLLDKCIRLAKDNEDNAVEGLDQGNQASPHKDGAAGVMIEVL